MAAVSTRLRPIFLARYNASSAALIRAWTEEMRGDGSAANPYRPLARNWKELQTKLKPQELHGKTMLVVGLGGLGTQMSRRAHAFGGTDHFAALGVLARSAAS